MSKLCLNRKIANGGLFASGEQIFEPHLIVAATEDAGAVVDHRGRSGRGFLPPLLFVHEEDDRVSRFVTENVTLGEQRIGMFSMNRLTRAPDFLQAAL